MIPVPIQRATRVARHRVRCAWRRSVAVLILALFFVFLLALFFVFLFALLLIGRVFFLSLLGRDVEGAQCVDVALGQLTLGVHELIGHQQLLDRDLNVEHLVARELSIGLERLEC